MKLSFWINSWLELETCSRKRGILSLIPEQLQIQSKFRVVICSRCKTVTNRVDNATTFNCSLISHGPCSTRTRHTLDIRSELFSFCPRICRTNTWNGMRCLVINGMWLKKDFLPLVYVMSQLRLHASFSATTAADQLSFAAARQELTIIKAPVSKNALKQFRIYEPI